MATQNFDSMLSSAQAGLSNAQSSGDQSRITAAQHQVDQVKMQMQSAKAGEPGSSSFGDYARALIGKYTNATPVAKAMQPKQ